MQLVLEGAGQGIGRFWVGGAGWGLGALRTARQVEKLEGSKDACVRGGQGSGHGCGIWGWTGGDLVVWAAGLNDSRRRGMNGVEEVCSGVGGRGCQKSKFLARARIMVKS